MNNTEIKPDEHGRWPMEFLAAQLEAIEAQIKSVIIIRDSNLKTVADNAGAFNLQATEMRDTAGLIVEMSSDLLRKLEAARDLIARDMRTAKGAHSYGRCGMCEQGGSEPKFLSAKRLFARPSADLCCKCQEDEETSRRIKQEEYHGRTPFVASDAVSA